MQANTPDALLKCLDLMLHERSSVGKDCFPKVYAALSLHEEAWQQLKLRIFVHGKVLTKFEDAYSSRKPWTVWHTTLGR